MPALDPKVKLNRLLSCKPRYASLCPGFVLISTAWQFPEVSPLCLLHESNSLRAVLWSLQGQGPSVQPQPWSPSCCSGKTLMLPGAGSQGAIAALNQAQHTVLLLLPFEVLQSLQCLTCQRRVPTSVPTVSLQPSLPRGL